MTSKTLTRHKAEAHEALYPALDRLTRQIEAMAARNPSAPGPEITRAIAADLLFEAQRFSSGLRRGLPEVAADIGGLASQLGRALAQLDAFEAAHIAWDAERKCFVWLLRDPLPVKRLRQVTSAPLKTAADQKRADFYRRKIYARMDERYDEGYQQGLADASSASQPPAAAA